MIPVLTRRALAERSRMLTGYVTGTVAMVVMMGAVWPTIEGNDEMQELVEQYPESLMALFGGSSSFDLSTAAGFLHIELMGLVAPLLVALLTIAFGAGTVAGDEEHGLLELVQSSGVPRLRVYLEKALGLLLADVTFAAAFTVALALTSLATDMDLTTDGLVAAGAAIAVLGWFVGALAIAVGAATGARGAAITIATVVAVAAYLVANLAELASWLEPLRPFSPYYQTVGRQPLSNGMAWIPLLVVVAVSLAVVALGAWRYDRRDLGA